MKHRLAHPQTFLEFSDELVTDSFAGGGGASLGIERGIGRPIDIAINHSPPAISMHVANHPNTQHFCDDVWEVDPRIITKGRPVALAWFSPDCKHHSKARGGKPKDKKIRGLAWVAVRWAATVRPRVIMLENVEEFRHWGPLDPITKDAIPHMKGKTFEHFKRRLEEQGYQVDHRELVACDYGAPTSRKRFFLIARCDGKPIVWPEPTHGPEGSGLIPYRTAFECIDWTIPCPSIFERKKPLVENTLKRIARGIQKFVIEDPDPLLLPPNVIPFSRSDNRAAVAHIIKHFGGVTGIRADRQFPTIMGRGTQNQIVTTQLITLRNNMIGRRTDSPLPTISGGGGHHAEVRALLMKYYGAKSGQYQSANDPIHTIPSKARYGIVTVHGQDYVIVDIGMRMLTPRELFTCQGFPESYIIDPDHNGKPLNKTLQTMCVGNSVPPQLSEALVRANFSESLREAA
jgi:DNA (cytosine-5)-methyltransferase 1